MYLIFFFELLCFFWGAVNAELTSVESADVWEAKFVRFVDAIPEIPNQPAAPDSSFFHIRLGGSAVKMFTIAALWGFSSSECLTKENVKIILSSSKSDFVAGDNPSNLTTMKFSMLSVLFPSKIENLSQNDQSSLFKENGYYMQVTSFIPEETILLRVEQYPSFHPEAHGICIQKFYYGITTLRDNRNFPETLFSAKFKKAVFRYSKSDGVFLTIGGISNPNSLVTYTLFDSNMDSIDQLSESVAVGLKRLIIEKESRLQLTLIIELHDTTLRHEIVYDHEAFQNNNEKTLEIIKLPPPNEVKRVEVHLGFSLCLGCRVQSVIACFKCNVDTSSKNDYAEFSSLKDHITTERINESLMKFDKLPFNKEYRNLAFSAENSAMNPSFEPKIQSQGFNIDSTKVFLTNKRIEEEESDESDTSFEYSSDFISENLLLRLPDVKSLNSDKLKHNNHLITYVFISLSYFAALFLIFWVWYYFRISQRIPMVDHSPLVEIIHAITESDEELISLESLSNSLSSNSILD